VIYFIQQPSLEPSEPDLAVTFDISLQQSYPSSYPHWTRTDQSRIFLGKSKHLQTSIKLQGGHSPEIQQQPSPN